MNKLVLFFALVFSSITFSCSEFEVTVLDEIPPEFHGRYASNRDDRIDLYEVKSNQIIYLFEQHILVDRRKIDSKKMNWIRKYLAENWSRDENFLPDYVIPKEGLDDTTAAKISRYKREIYEINDSLLLDKYDSRMDSWADTLDIEISKIKFLERKEKSFLGLFFWGKKWYLNEVNDLRLSVSAKDRGYDLIFEIQFYQKYHDQLGTKLKRFDVIEEEVSPDNVQERYLDSEYFYQIDSVQHSDLFKVTYDRIK